MVMSMKRSKDGGYYTRCMASDKDRAKGIDDNYTGAKEPPGIWMVYSALESNNPNRSALGVVHGQRFNSEDARIDIAKFHSLVKGCHPETGLPVVQNPNDPKRMGLIDFCYSAPKSVSVVWSQSDQKLRDKIEAIQTQSAAYAMNFLASKLISRTEKKGVVRTSVAAAVIALFGHGSSRANDPQLHTHSCLLNAVLRRDGKTGAVDEFDAMQWQGVSASLYHMKLAWEMRNIGFEIEKRDKIFDIKGVPQEVNSHFSKRTKEVKQKAEEFKKRVSMKPNSVKDSFGILEIAAAESRDDKNELTRAQLEELWIVEGKRLGFSKEQVLALRCMGEPRELSAEELMEEASKAFPAIHENDSVFTEPTLLTMVAVQLIGLCDPDRALEAVQRLKNEVLLSTEIPVKLKGRTGIKTIYTTPKMVGIEGVMLIMAKRMDRKHVLREGDIKDAIHATEKNKQKPLKLSEEQILAVLAATRDNNAVTVIEGAAGACKSTVLQVITEAYSHADYEVEDLLKAGKASKNRKIQAEKEVARIITCWSSMVDSGEIELNEKTVILLDEADILGSMQIKQVLERAKDFGCKVILFGDTLQQKSFATGDPLRCLVKEIGSTRLDTIASQNRQEDKLAVKDFFSGKAKEGLKPYIQRGNVFIAPNEEETNKRLIADWMQSRTMHQDKSHLIITGDKETASELNLLAHQARLDAGELGYRSLQLACVDCLNDKGDIKYTEFRVGDIVALRKYETWPSNPVARLQEAQKFRSLELGTVVGIDSETLFVKLKESDRTIFVDPEQEKWQNQKGEVLIQHGYALTTYSSQGLAQDLLFVRDGVSMDRVSAGLAMSRHRVDCRLYVDKRERWKEYLKPKFMDEYVPLREFSNQDCLDHLAKRWSRDLIKESTLGYRHWLTPEGYECNLEAPKIIELENSRMEQLQRDMDRIIRQSEFQEVEPTPTMPFQLDREYSIAESAEVYKDDYLYWLYADDADSEVNRYEIDELVCREALMQDFMRRREDGSVVFIARGKNREIVYATDIHGNKAEDCPYLFNAETWPQYLKGDEGVKTLSVVNTPLEALQLRCLQLWDNSPMSIILVAGKNGDGLRSEMARDFGARAKVIERYDFLAQKTMVKYDVLDKSGRQSKHQIMQVAIGAEYQHYLAQRHQSEQRMVQDKP